MSDNTSIEWTDATWNPIRARRRDGQPNRAGGGWACQRVSPGCVHCYAAGINKRLGTGLDYDARGIADSDIYLDERILAAPLRWKSPRRVFVCSMTDLFGEWVPDEVIDRVFAVMALSPQHTYQLLTKRPERMREYLANEDRMYVLRSGIEEWCPEDLRWPLPNVWLGVSAEDQERADQRIPELLATPAAVRFLSCEPLLGPVNLRAVKPDAFSIIDALDGSWEQSLPEWEGNVEYVPDGPHIDWIIVGGESGPGARPCDVSWIRGIVQQCAGAGVAVFVKQLGSAPSMSLADWAVASKAHNPMATETDLRLRDRKGGDMSEWPENLKVREFPEVGR